MFCTENEVDGFSFLEMKEADIFLMLPGKIGPARKLTSLLSKHRLDEGEPSLKHNTIADEDTPPTTPQGKSSDTEIQEVDMDASDTSCSTPDFKSLKTCSATKDGQASSPRTPRMTVETLHPTYSKPIQCLLDNGSVKDEWFKFIEETAYHVLVEGAFDERGIYGDFGRFMCTKYPCLKYPSSKTPWHYFNQVLSQKVRTIRHQRKRRSEKMQGSFNGKRKRNHLVMATIEEAPEMEAGVAQKTIEAELKKTKEQQDKALILKAQRASFKERRQFVEQFQEDGSIQEVVKEHPILRIAHYVEKEFFLVKPNIASKNTLVDRITELLHDLDRVFRKDGSEDEELDDAADTNGAVLEILMKAEEKVKFVPRKNKKTLPNILTKVDVKHADLTSRRKEAPRLLAVTNNELVGSCFVVADGIAMEVSSNVKEALLSLIFTYYVWDMNYPKHFQLLGLLQTLILKDDGSTFFKSATYIKFLKDLQETSSSDT